jgi:hypothetical protein
MVPNSELQRAEQGLHEALDRLDNRINDPATGDPLIPVAEALNWAYGLECWHRPRLKALGIDYSSLWKRYSNGKITAGVIYARNRVAHQLATVGKLLDFYQDTYEDAYGDVTGWRWRPFSELPKPDPGFTEKQGRDKKYECYVQNKPLLIPLRAAEHFFTVTVLTYYT